MTTINIKDVLRKKLLNDIRCDILPDDVTINTMTVIADTDIKFNASNIAKYIDMAPDGIIKISHGRSGDTQTNRTIIHKKKVKKLKKKKKSFSSR